MNTKIKKIISEYSLSKCDENIETFCSSTHHTREICYVVKGKSLYMLNNRVFVARPGTVFLLNHWVPHAFGYRKEDSDLLHLWIFLAKQNIAALVNVTENGNYFMSASVKLPEDLKNALSASWDAFDQLGKAGHDDSRVLKTDLEMIFAEINLLFKENSRRSLRVLDAQVIEQIKNYIHMTNSRNCSLGELEKISGYNRFYLSHCFKKHEKCTIGEYINKVRIDYTVEALKKGIMQKEIAFELGFSSASNFWLWLDKHRQEVRKSMY